MIIPYKELPSETLEAIIEAFILQEGTEYGEIDVSKNDKIAQVKMQLSAGTAVLVYSELHESVNIMPAEQFNQAIEESSE
ncbi:MAG: YheU family protein [Colwellia sp.]